MDEGQLNNDVRETVIRLDALERNFNNFQTNISQTLAGIQNQLKELRETPKNEALTELKNLITSTQAKVGELNDWCALLDKAIKDMRKLSTVNPQVKVEKPKSFFEWLARK